MTEQRPESVMVTLPAGMRFFADPLKSDNRIYCANEPSEIKEFFRNVTETAELTQPLEKRGIFHLVMINHHRGFYQPYHTTADAINRVLVDAQFGPFPAKPHAIKMQVNRTNELK